MHGLLGFAHSAPPQLCGYHCFVPSSALLMPARSRIQPDFHGAASGLVLGLIPLTLLYAKPEPGLGNPPEGACGGPGLFVAPPRPPAHRGFHCPSARLGVAVGHVLCPMPTSWPSRDPPSGWKLAPGTTTSGDFTKLVIVSPFSSLTIL